MTEILALTLAIIALIYSLIIIIYQIYLKKLLTSYSFIEISFVVAFYLNIMRIFLYHRQEFIEDSFIITIIIIVIAHFSYEIGYRLFRRNQLILGKFVSTFFKMRLPNAILVPVFLFSFIGIFSWIKYFNLYGGVWAYLYEGGLAIRVLKARGYGWLLILINFYNIANTLFYIYILSIWKKKILIKKKLSKYFLTIFFIFHTFLYFLLVTPLGQRGGIFWKVVLFGIIFYYFYKHISQRSLILGGCILLVLAFMLNTVRSYPNDYLLAFSQFGNVDYYKGFIKEGWGFNVRLDALYKIIDAVPKKFDYQLGKTYLSLITQFIPRKWFPEKLETAGYFITREITRSSSYRGTAHDAPTFIGEAYLNFGVFGVVLALILLGWVCKIFDSLKNLCEYSPIVIYLYAFLMISMFTLFLGEFTNVVFGLIYNILSIFIFLILSNILSIDKKD